MSRLGRIASLLCAAVILVSAPAWAQGGIGSSGISGFSPGNSPRLPWNTITPYSPLLNNGLNITSGYGGALDNSVQTRIWGESLNYGNENCSDQLYRIFNPVRGFAAGFGTCGVNALGSTVSQFIGGLFSLEDHAGNGIPLVAQGITMENNINTWAINTVKSDSYNKGYSTSSSISGTTLTVGGTVTGVYEIGDILTGTGVPAGLQITGLGTGTGGAGTYVVNRSVTVSSRAITSKSFLYGVLVQDEFDNFCVQNDTRCRNIIDGYFPNGNQASVEGVTVGGTLTVGDRLTVTITDTRINNGSPYSITYTTASGDTTTTMAAGLALAANADSALLDAGYWATSVSNIVRIYYPTNNGISFLSTTFSTSVSGAGTETLTSALISSGNNQRYGIGVATFSGSNGHWQNGFYVVNGAADFSLKSGRSTSLSIMGDRSQALGFIYTDNTSGVADRVATLYADPTNAGSSGVDLTVSSASNQTTSLSIPNGSLKVAGRTVVSSSGDSVHQMLVGRSTSVTGSGTTTCGSLSGPGTAGTCGNGQWMVPNQNGQFSKMRVEIATPPGAGNSISITLVEGNVDTNISCTITDTNASCSDSAHTVAVTAGNHYYYKYISSAGATTATLYPSISFNNPAP